MKKIIISAVMLCLSAMAFAQITVVGGEMVKIASYDMGFSNLYAYVEANDTTYMMSLKTNNEYHGNISVRMGYAEQAIALMESLLEYDDDGKELMISFNNPSENSAYLKNILGVPTYYVFERNGSGRIYGYIYKPMLKKWIQKLKAYAGIK